MPSVSAPIRTNSRCITTCKPLTNNSVAMLKAPVAPFVFAASALLLVNAGASVREEGVGILYGENHAFSLQAPKGWVLDNESGVKQDIYAVFYPKGSTGKESAVVAYTRSRPRTKEIATADDAAKDVIREFHANGSPKYRGKRIKTVKTTKGKEAVIYHYSGDAWGNKEAAAYFVEEKTINFVVLTARQPELFTSSLAAFEALVHSYEFLGDKLPEVMREATLSPGLYEDTRSRARAMGETEEGKRYEHSLSSEVTDIFARPFHDALQECSKDVKAPYQTSVVLVIAADGIVKIVTPGTEPVAACVAEKLKGLKLPPPPRADWLMSVNVELKE